MIRITIFAWALLAALPLHAACAGANLIDELGPDDRTTLDSLVAVHPYPTGNLWRADKPGSTVHVVGTIHVPDPRLDPIARRVLPWVAEADVLILEASSDMQTDLQRRMVENPSMAFLTEGPTLIDILGDDTWGDLADELRARGVPPFMAAKFKPWLMAMTLAIPSCALDALGSGQMGLDGRLEVGAREAGTPIAVLDNIEAVINLLGAGTIEEQVDMLRIALATEQDNEAAFSTTLDSYFAGQHRELWEFSRLMTRQGEIDDPDAAFDRFETSLLITRNADWERKVAPLVADRSAVLAVGAAHLSGETGVLRALERLGYTLVPLEGN
ncbi:MAG: TraB/GumN family protein [Pseudomonadota bacterium]